MTEARPDCTDDMEADEQGQPEGTNQQEAEQAQSDDPIENLENELAIARQEAASAIETMLLMKADMENLRKRLVRENEKARRRTLERFMNDLLPVRDSLERGLAAAEEPSATIETLSEGKQMIMRMLNKVLGDHGLETIDPVGEAFDPEKHEAMAMVPSAEHDENTIIDVLEKGYQLHDRLIKPAKVVVSRKP